MRRISECEHRLLKQLGDEWHFTPFGFHGYMCNKHFASSDDWVASGGSSLWLASLVSCTNFSTCHFDYFILSLF